MTGSSQLDVRHRAAVAHQLFFREVNDRIAEISDRFGGNAEYVCECRDLACAEVVPFSIQEYAAIRANSNCFFVLSGHEVADVEEVVGGDDRYLIVRGRSANGTVG